MRPPPTSSGQLLELEQRDKKRLEVDEAENFPPPPPEAEETSSSSSSSSSNGSGNNTDDKSRNEDAVRVANPDSVPYEVSKVRSCQQKMGSLCQELENLDKQLKLAILGVEGSGVSGGRPPVYLDLVDTLCLRDAATELTDICTTVAIRANELANTKPRHPIETRAENMPPDLTSLLQSRRIQEKEQEAEQRERERINQQPSSNKRSPTKDEDARSPSDNEVVTHQRRERQLNASPSASPGSSLRSDTRDLDEKRPLSMTNSFEDDDEDASTLSSARSRPYTPAAAAAAPPPPMPPAYIYTSSSKANSQDSQKRSGSSASNRARIEGDLGGIWSSESKDAGNNTRDSGHHDNSNDRPSTAWREVERVARMGKEGRSSSPILPQTNRGMRFGDESGAGKIAVGGVLVAVTPGSRPASAAAQARQTASRQASRRSQGRAAQWPSQAERQRAGDGNLAASRRPATAAAALATAPMHKSAAEQDEAFWDAAEATVEEMKAGAVGVSGTQDRAQPPQQRAATAYARARPSTADFRSSLLKEQQQAMEEGRAAPRPQSKFRKNRIGL